MTELVPKPAGEICGRDVTAVPGGPVSSRPSAERGRARFVVDGITHPKGQPIKFKSRDRAERHIRNMRMEVR